MRRADAPRSLTSGHKTPMKLVSDISPLLVCSRAYSQVCLRKDDGTGSDQLRMMSNDHMVIMAYHY